MQVVVRFSLRCRYPAVVDMYLMCLGRHLHQCLSKAHSYKVRQKQTKVSPLVFQSEADAYACASCRSATSKGKLCPIDSPL